MKKIVKQLIVYLIATLLLFENAIPVLAASTDEISSDTSKYVIRGNVEFSPATLKELFDANYYLMLYPELRAVYGDNAELLYQHFVTYGLSEGRKCSPYLDIAKYVANNTDLSVAFGSDFDSFVSHYFTCGINEGRDSYSTKLDLLIQKNLENAPNIYVDGTLNDEAVKTLYGSAFLEISVSQDAYSYSVDSNSHSSDNNSQIIISDDVIAIPWDYVENGYVTLEMIKAHCGDNLILVQNSSNDVTFISGDISSKKVKDQNSVLEAVQSFFGVLNYPSDTCYLYLSAEHNDSEGNHIYTFQSRDSDTDIISNKIIDAAQDCLSNCGAVTGTVILKTDKYGNIIGLSSTDNDTFDAFDYSTITNNQYLITDARYNLKKLTLEEIADVLSKDYEVLSYLPEEYSYSGKISESFYKFFVKKDGNLYMMCVRSEQDINNTDLKCSRYPIDESVYFSTQNPGEKSQPYDNLYTNVDVIYKTFTDSNGREISLPLAWDENGYYFCAPEYKLILEMDPVEGSGYDVDAQYGLGLCYVDIENPDINVVTIFSNMYEACKTYYGHCGSNNTLPTLMALYSPNLTVENAFGMSDYAFSIMTYCNYKPFINDVSTAGHESTHAYTMEEGLIGTNYVKFMGAISEGYSDIVGIIIQQKVLEEYLHSESEKTGKSIDTVYNELIASKKWLIDKDDWYSGAAYDDDGNASWLYKASNPVATSYNGVYAEKIGGVNFVYDRYNDDYGSHINSSILSHIAYEMWNNDVEKDYDKLFDIWYDTCYVMTGNSTFYDVRNYIEASMKEKNYSQEKIDQTMEFFDQANITKETQDFLVVSNTDKPDNFYASEYINGTGTNAEVDLDSISAPSFDDDNNEPGGERSAQDSDEPESDDNDTDSNESESDDDDTDSNESESDDSDTDSDESD